MGRGQMAVIVSFFAGALAGCARRVDMSKVNGPDQPALTIPYTGVREESRQFPDYGPIGAGILTEQGVSKPTKNRKSP